MKLTFVEKKQETPTIYSFIFKPETPFQFTAGQFMRLTISHENADSRGVSRNFSIASSPTEGFIMIATRFIEDGSSFKKILFELKFGSKIEAAGPFGRFTLPESTNDCIFITGGIGITPVRSILKYATDKQMQNRLVLLCSNRTTEEVPFHNFFNELQTQNKKFELIQTVTRLEQSSVSWDGRVGRIDEKLVWEKIKNAKETLFYLCGPKSLLDTFYSLLLPIGVKEESIKRENFPGY